MKGFRPPQAIPPAGKPLTSKRVYDVLRRAIIHGELAGGTKLGEMHVGAELGVSRTPVREAFAELLNQGLLVAGTGRQVVIADPSPELIDEVVLMRDALEPVLARQAAETMDVSELDQLRLIMIRARRATAVRDVNAFLDCDDDFHLHIPHAAGLLLAEDALRRVRVVTRLGARPQDWDDVRFARIADEHDAIIDALEATAGDRAAAAMAAHLAASTPY